MANDSDEIDLTLKLSLDKPHAQSAEQKFLIRSSSSSSIAWDMSKSLVRNGARGGSSVPSLCKPCSLGVKAEKIESEDLWTIGRPNNVKRLVLQKQNKAEAEMTKKEKSPAVSQRLPLPAYDRPKVPPEVIARAAASVSKNPAFIRALAQINDDLKRFGDLKHKGARGLTRGGATSRFLRLPRKEKDPMIHPESVRPAKTMSGNLLKKVKLEHPCMLEGDSMDTQKQMPSVTMAPMGRQ